MRLHTQGTPVRMSLWLAVVFSTLLMLVSPVSAHTGFESSSPGDSAIIDTPLSTITLTFSGEATPAGEGFVVLDPTGAVRVPNDISSDDNLTWTLRFDDALAGGVVGVRWSVAAPDAHPIDGSFSFTVTAPPPVDATTTTTPTPATAPTTTTLVRSDEIEPEPKIALDDFLETSSDTARGASLLATSSRILRLLGAVGAIGGIFFAAFVLRGDPRDIRAVLFVVRRAGVIIVLGAVTQLAAQIASAAQGWAGLWSMSTVGNVVWSSLGAAIALRMVGGVIILIGARLDTHEAAGATDHVVAFKHLATVGTGFGGAESADAPNSANKSHPLAHDGDEAWRMSESPAAFVGLGLLALSFLFDGHTVSEGPRWIHALTNIVHVMTAATWAGGVVMLAVVVARRHRRGADVRALQLGMRFSVVAVVALVAAALAGTALTVIILDSVSDIWTTSWGRLLVLKALLVIVAGIGGGYNHRVVIPELERSPDDLDLAHRFRTIVSLEAAALIAVTIVTALLIGASAT